MSVYQHLLCSKCGKSESGQMTICVNSSQTISRCDRYGMHGFTALCSKHVDLVGMSLQYNTIAHIDEDGKVHQKAESYESRKQKAQTAMKAVQKEKQAEESIEMEPTSTLSYPAETGGLASPERVSSPDKGGTGAHNKSGRFFFRQQSNDDRVKAEDEEALRQAKLFQQERQAQQAASSMQRLAEDEAEQRAKENERRKALEEETKRKAEEEIKAAEEAHRLAVQEAKRTAQEEVMRQKAEDESRRLAEVDAKRRAQEEEMQKRAAEDARRFADEKAKRTADELLHENPAGEAWIQVEEDMTTEDEDSLLNQLLQRIVGLEVELMELMELRIYSLEQKLRERHGHGDCLTEAFRSSQNWLRQLFKPTGVRSAFEEECMKASADEVAPSNPHATLELRYSYGRFSLSLQDIAVEDLKAAQSKAMEDALTTKRLEDQVAYDTEVSECQVKAGAAKQASEEETTGENAELSSCILFSGLCRLKLYDAIGSK
eukprot:gnl/MRDRNA2_/MRDRNA2_108879_c0_seq1.p1 gnl/MRDRNA2_/MRDRNA2_108879_c0~~gnl/MRDRNA2_/MRDRNA2_108879_c0_seq1.p1  ORF type:complete len:488 (-),score=149.77 gnl/MRDRNA2_/MRDRNA2_108879_c0_seq1:48-1511(-)